MQIKPMTRVPKKNILISTHLSSSLLLLKACIFQNTFYGLAKYTRKKCNSMSYELLKTIWNRRNSVLCYFEINAKRNDVRHQTHTHISL